MGKGGSIIKTLCRPTVPFFLPMLPDPHIFVFFDLIKHTVYISAFAMKTLNKTT